MASTTRMPDRATVSTPTLVGTTVHLGSPSNRHQTKASTSTNVLLQSRGRTAVVDTSSPTITIIVKGKEIAGTIIDRGSGVNVISRRTCDTLGIRKWELCPFWLPMADTNSVRPTRLIRDLDVTIGGHAFCISAVVLQLNVQGSYPLLLG